jgi:cytidylate kinase
MTIKFVAGDPVKVVGGVYKGRSSVVKKPTEKMYYILLDNGEIVRLMASSVLRDDALRENEHRKNEGLTKVAQELQLIRQRMEMLIELIRDFKF